MTPSLAKSQKTCVILGSILLSGANSLNDSTPEPNADNESETKMINWAPVLIYASIAVTITFIIVMIIIFQDIRRRHRMTSEEMENTSSQDNENLKKTKSNENVLGYDQKPVHSPDGAVTVDSVRSDPI